MIVLLPKLVRLESYPGKHSCLVPAGVFCVSRDKLLRLKTWRKVMGRRER